MNKHIIFAVIAMREVKFFLNVSDQLRKYDYKISFISFFQPGNALILNRGYECYDIYEYLNKIKNGSSSNFNYYGIDDVVALIKHEKLTFGLKFNKFLIDKFSKYLAAVSSIIEEIEVLNNDKKLIIFQELGGFIAPLSLYFVCKRMNYRHIFFEPSFFKSRLLFIENKLTSQMITEKICEINPKVENYLINLKKENKIAIPDKDKHHFRDMSFEKIINNDNIKKYLNKIYYKYIKFQKQEYDKINNHIYRNVKMLFNRKSIAKYYSDLEDIKNIDYYFFPFHVPLDYALTIRSPQYLDQIKTVRKIAKILPSNHFIVVKEHPAGIGAYDKLTVQQLLEDCSNLIFLNPNINSHLVTENAVAVITINSKVGAEALVKSKTIFSLGDSFYNNSSLVYSVNNIEELKLKLEEINQLNKNFDDNILKLFFQNLWDSSYPGELYQNEESNIEEFTHSIHKFIQVSNKEK